MPSQILSVGQSALAAAQIGLTTTGHNIANANTPGYSRQVIVQGTAAAQDSGFGFIGKGTTVQTVQRVFNEYLANRVLSAQVSQNELSTYYSQIQQINNMFADQTSGLSPRLQEFFAAVNNVASNPNSDGARQTMLSQAATLSGQFQAMDSQLKEMRDGVNTQITDSITTINSYAKQIAELNDAIEKAQAGSDGKPANDLLDQRDHVVAELSKEIKVSIVKQGDSYNVFIGNGQPLVVNSTGFNLVATTSPTDLSRIELGYQSNGQTITLAENSIAGGRLGGLFQFRSQTLDSTQGALDRLALSIATTFNAQHKLGQDQTGALGKDFFSFSTIPVSPAVGTQAVIGATVSDASALTTSDYQLRFDGTNYIVTRLSDGKTMYSGNSFPSAANQAIEGVTLTPPAAPPAAQIANGNSYLIRPAYGAASSLAVALTDKSEIAAAAPIRTIKGKLVGGVIVNNNLGTGTISAGVVDSTYPSASSSPPTSTLPVTLQYDKTNNRFFVVGSPATTFNYTPGANISFGGVTFSISGTPEDGDNFTVGQNTNGTGDNSNALLLLALQTTNTMGKNLTTGVATSTFQGAYAQLVNGVGNKTHELEVTSSAEDKLLAEATAAQQADSGVNLDEEATNMIRYQQAYQAAGKVMQTANQLFDILLNLGG